MGIKKRRKQKRERERERERDRGGYKRKSFKMLTLLFS